MAQAASPFWGGLVQQAVIKHCAENAKLQQYNIYKTV